ncbi:single-stranded DNA-binding protein [Marinicellulosiphila megalodicopiae]|uniref:single-stranded DNA-binding protein n=1 Tax=Marinicellulosiphila megalodicopiae TaxID=2724896 RepID=UPI003BAFED15
MAKGSVNKVIIVGRLGKDPDIKATASGTQIATLSVATTELGRKDPATGVRGPDETEWHRVVLFGFLAENAATYLKKGSRIYIEGKLKTRKWTDNIGIDRYTTEVTGLEMQFLGNKAANQAVPGNQQPLQKNNNQQNNHPQPAEGNGFDDFDDDIPF